MEASGANSARRRAKRRGRARPDAQRSAWRSAWRSGARWLLPPAAAALAHAPALGNGFAWLDAAHLEVGLALAPPGAWPRLFTEGFAGTGFYRPLTALSLSVDAALGGAPALFHATTLGWHAAASAGVALAAESLGLQRRAATLAGVLFAVHPLTSLVASAIAFRSEAMVVVSLSVLVFAHVARRPWLAGAAMLAGALAKETALVLGPLFALALELPAARPRRAEAAPPLGRAPLFAAEGAALALALFLRLAFAPPFRATSPELPLSEALGTRLANFARALEAVAVLDRSVCDATPVVALASPPALAGALAVLALAAFAFRARGIALLLALSALPVAQVVPVMRFWSPHYVYVPSAFLAMLAARSVERAARRWPSVTPFAVGALVVLGVTSARSAARFRSDVALWLPEVAREPACREGHFYLAEAARERGAFAEAAASYEAALAPRPRRLAYVDRGATLQNLGIARVELGDLEGAESAFRDALEGAAPRTRRALLHNLAGLALARGAPDEALRLLGPEATGPDAPPETLYVAAKALRDLGRHAESRALVARLEALGWGGRPDGR